MRVKRSRIVIAWLLVCFFWLQNRASAQDLQLPGDYSIDLQLAETGRSHIMKGTAEITGTRANEIGNDVFHRLTSAGFSQPYPWKLTLVNSGSVNASSTAGGQVYVFGGILPILGQNEGLWAAALSHETAHTGRRHQVRVYMQLLYNQRMVQFYRSRAAAGDKSANWALIGFVAASALTLKKLQRDQEHDADQQGMLVMARAGYHPDFVFALHHLLLMNTGERSKFSAFFADHPRWETRDQRSDRVYADALGEFNHQWPNALLSPGGGPPVVAFIGKPQAKENKETQTADITVPLFCRNAEGPVVLVVVFLKDNRPVKAADPEFADKDGNLTFAQNADCPAREDNTPLEVHVPARAVSAGERSLKAEALIGNKSELIARSAVFDIHFPKVKKH